MHSHPTIRHLAQQLHTGELSCEQLISTAITKAQAHRGIFLYLDEADLLGQARRVDQQRANGDAQALAGIPISLKDLFNVQGQQTLAGSVVLADKAPLETDDAKVVAYLRQAGMVFFGRTNMSEFAFSGMGLNDHFPALYSIWNQAGLRIPGGSSSGSALSVAQGIVPATLGSDTTGSCRIPAAFNGIVGMKPSHGRLSLAGVYPLSHSCDAPGPLAVDVDSCFLLDQLMQGKALDSFPLPTLAIAKPQQLRLLLPDSAVMQDLDPDVERTFNQALEKLQAAGVKVIKQPMPLIDQCIDMFFHRNTVMYEAWQLHRELITEHGDAYGDYVRTRIESGHTISEAEQAARYEEKAQLIQRFREAFLALKIDALVYPTVSCIPPLVADTEDADTIGAINLRCLRNTSSVNYFDGCAISLPCHQPNEAPVGLMLSSIHGDDARLLEIAAGIESVLR